MNKKKQRDESSCNGNFAYEISKSEDGSSEVMLRSIYGNRTEQQGKHFGNRDRHDPEPVRFNNDLKHIKDDRADQADNGKLSPGA